MLLLEFMTKFVKNTCKKCSPKSNLKSFEFWRVNISIDMYFDGLSVHQNHTIKIFVKRFPSTCIISLSVRSISWNFDGLSICQKYSVRFLMDQSKYPFRPMVFWQIQFRQNFHQYANFSSKFPSICPVSYTHLTLPTKRIV